MEKDIGKILKGEFQGTKTEIVIGLREYNGKTGIDIREFTQSPTYTGPTKKGLRIPSEKFKEFKELINAIDENDLTLAETKPEEKAEKASTLEAPEEDSGISEDGTM